MSQCIEWRHDGTRLIVTVRVLPPFIGTNLDGLDGRALIDTGSTTTGIRQHAARALGLKGIGKRPMSTVGGDTQIERYVFRIGLAEAPKPDQPPTFPFIFEEIVGFELRDGFTFDVLLGMDILKQCSLSFDSRGNCRLAFGQ